MEHGYRVFARLQRGDSRLAGVGRHWALLACVAGSPALFLGSEVVLCLEYLQRTSFLMLCLLAGGSAQRQGTRGRTLGLGFVVELLSQFAHFVWTGQNSEEGRFCARRLSCGCSDWLGKQTTLANDWLSTVTALRWGWVKKSRILFFVSWVHCYQVTSCYRSQVYSGDL